MSSNVLYCVDVCLPLNVLFCYLLFSCLSVASSPFTIYYYGDIDIDIAIDRYIDRQTDRHSLHSIRIS